MPLSKKNTRSLFRDSIYRAWQREIWEPDPSCVIRQGSNQRWQGTNFRRNERTLSSTAVQYFSRWFNSSAIFEVWLRYCTFVTIRQSNVTLSPLTLLSLIMLNQRSLACLSLWESKHLLEINLTTVKWFQNYLLSLCSNFKRRIIWFFSFTYYSVIGGFEKLIRQR